MKFLLVAAVLLISISILACENSGKPETDFKSICKEIRKQAAASVSPAGPEHSSPQEEIDKNMERDRQQKGKWETRLREVIQKNPNGPWADDAQFLIAAFCSEPGRQEAEELEKLIQTYPNMEFESWTKETLVGRILPTISMESYARLKIIFHYCKMGSTERLQKMCEESIQKFPKGDKRFENILKRCCPNQAP